MRGATPPDPPPEGRPRQARRGLLGLGRAGPADDPRRSSASAGQPPGGGDAEPAPPTRQGLLSGGYGRGTPTPPDAARPPAPPPPAPPSRSRPGPGPGQSGRFPPAPPPGQSGRFPPGPPTRMPAGPTQAPPGAATRSPAPPGISGRYPQGPGQSIAGPAPARSGRYPVDVAGPTMAPPGGTMRTHRVPASAYTAAPASSTGRATIPVPEPGKHQLRFAIFHGGNPGHLWRGELFSLLGDAVVAAGVVMWLALLTASPRDVAFALFALGLPALLAGPLATPLTRLQDSVRLFNLFGRLRVLFALALIGMHYDTILPVLYLLLFGLSLCGRLRSALRVAAARTCLAPGEPERVAASTHFAAVVVAVAGPLLAALLFILNGERILSVVGGAVAAYLLGAAADAQLDPLPRTRRAFLLARPEEEDDPPDPSAEDDADLDEDPDEALHRREAALPEWQQWGPGSLRQAWRDVRDGLGLASSDSLSAVGLRALAALALVGGGLGVFEVFYLTDHLLLPTFYLGPLLAAEGAGLALGATIWSDLGRRGSGRAALVVGTAASGVALVAMADAQGILQALLAAVLLGGTNAVAVEGGRQALRAGFDGLQRRALAAAESLITGLCALAGIPLFVLFHYGYAVPASGGAAGPQVLIAPYSAPALFFAGGICLMVAAVVVLLMLILGAGGGRRRARRVKRRASRGGARRGARRDADAWDESGAYGDESGLYTADSASYPAAGDYDEDQDLDDWVEDEEYPDYRRVRWDEDRDDRPPRGRGGRPRR